MYRMTICIAEHGRRVYTQCKWEPNWGATIDETPGKVALFFINVFGTYSLLLPTAYMARAHHAFHSPLKLETLSRRFDGSGLSPTLGAVYLYNHVRDEDGYSHVRGSRQGRETTDLHR